MKSRTLKAGAITIFKTEFCVIPSAQSNLPGFAERTKIAHSSEQYQVDLAEWQFAPIYGEDTAAPAPNTWAISFTTLEFYDICMFTDTQT